MKYILLLRNFLGKGLIIITPLLSVLLLYVFNWNIVSILTHIFPQLEQVIKQKPAVEMAASTALLTMIISAITWILKSPGLYKLSIHTSSGRKSSTVIDLNFPHRQPRIDVILECTFKWTWVYNFVRWLSDIELIIELPRWLNYGIDNKSDIDSRSIVELPNKKLVINLGQAMQGNIKKPKLYLMFIVNADGLANINSGSIVGEFKITSLSFKKNPFRKIVFYLFLFFFISFKSSEHEIEVTKDSR